MEITVTEVETAGEEKVRFFSRLCRWLKALLGKLSTKVVKVVKSIIKLGQDDPRRVTHSLKVALALTVVSILYYWRVLFDGIGIAGIWAVITVVVVFEFTVGATLSKGLNRGFATFIAGAFGLGATHIASLFGVKGEPIVLGIFVFLLAAASTFLRFFPRIKARYDYGVLIFLLTFSMVTVSGYHVEGILEMSNERLLTIAIGGGTCMIISAFVCPVWAGEDLHKLISSNIENLANYLEGFGGEYFPLPKDGKSAGITSKSKESFLQGYKSVLNSKSSEESLANFARWEPGHGHFKFRHPWKQYLKIGALARECAYQIETLNGHINSDVQVPPEFLQIIQDSCKTMSIESGKALKALAVAIKTMEEPKDACEHLENSKTAVKDLKIALKAASLETADILAIVPAATVASILVEIVKGVEKISKSVHELSELAHFKKAVECTVSQEKPLSLHSGSVNPVLLDGEDAHVIITVGETNIGSQENEINPKARNDPKPRERNYLSL